MEYSIVPMDPHDWKQVRAVYIEGIATGHATFESEAPGWEGWDRAHRHDCRLVARTEDSLLGWAALSPVSGRRAYAGVAEVSLYVSSGYWGQGIGSALLAALIEASERAGIWTLQTGILPENAASLGLFQRHGFREVGRREKLGKMTYGPLSGHWRDVYLLERRSAMVGI